MILEAHSRIPGFFTAGVVLVIVALTTISISYWTNEVTFVCEIGPITTLEIEDPDTGAWIPAGEIRDLLEPTLQSERVMLVNIPRWKMIYCSVNHK